MKLLKDLQRLFFTSKDSKPVAVAFILERDDCSRLLGEFNDKHLEGCRKLVIISEDADGAVNVSSSENTSTVELTGLLAIASRMVSSDGE